jgi:hypothetical protein
MFQRLMTDSKLAYINLQEIAFVCPELSPSWHPEGP